MRETGSSGSLKMLLVIVCLLCFACLVQAVDDVSTSVDLVTSRAARLKRDANDDVPSGLSHLARLLQEPLAQHEAQEEGIVQDLHSQYPTFPDPRCHPRPESMYLNLTEVAYNYPQEEIFQELYRKRYLMNEILESKWINKNLRLDDLKSSPHQYPRECTAHVSSLEGFSWNGDSCWVLFPWYQNVEFVRCRYPRCNGYYNQCVATDVVRPVWAFCWAFPYGDRIARLELPLPSYCQCASGYC